ncbi:MerR family transcriptional regulator [Wukongibacter sp. M2B1]|uniref:MerR family transcriptional regulator n=1 Tax=Wukongibacter sp. M2B1 TaxID=3088895 RepID=UPI003D79AA6B
MIMIGKTYTTKQIADIAQVHPNTVRLYEKWGYISKAERMKNNYRVFNKNHLYQMKLARASLPGPYPIDGKIVHGLVKKFAADDIEGALDLAKEYSAQVEIETERAKEALKVLDSWFEDNVGDRNNIMIETRKKASAYLGVSIDSLRTWERNGLFSIKKNGMGILIFSEWDIEKIMVIRLLRNCGYSIASLLRVFGKEGELEEKPSKILSLPDNDSDINYDTDMFLKYLDEHRDRAETIIKLIIQKYIFVKEVAGEKKNNYIGTK